MAKEKLLEVKNLKTYFQTSQGTAKAVDGVSFSIRKGETLGMVGESGCGKSVTSLSILRLIPSPPGRIEDGEIIFHDENILSYSEAEMRKVRGNRISMIFQEPMTSLNPVFTIGDQVGEVFRIHKGMTRKESIDEAARMLDLVRIPNAKQRVHEYPHQMSGGMRQRVMIAMALACNPELLIADEPTTALDITIQAQILELMEQLKEEFNSSILLITHDLGVIAEIADFVVVMYAGKVVECGSVYDIFEKPSHPYTLGLLKSIPKLEEIHLGKRLEPIPDNVPDPAHYPPGCRFAGRCPFATEECRVEIPELVDVGENHQSACIHIDKMMSSV